MRTYISYLAIIIGCGLSTAIHAQDAGADDAQRDSAVGEIIVTAQKRSESLQKVPLAVTAVTSDDLARSEIRDIAGVTALAPNLNLGPHLGVAKVALRGIGLENMAAGAEGSIAFHMDGVFISRSIAALSSFYDVQQVEVLRGPQGTLYGRNATGGSINITTRKPTQDLSGYANVTFGNYNRIVAEGAVSGALVPDVLSARVAFQTENRDGYGKNIVTGNEIDDRNTWAIRGTLLFTPTDRLSLEVKGDYFRESDHSGGYHFVGGAGFSAPGVPVIPTGLLAGGTVATNVRDISNESDPRNRVKFWGISGKLAYDLLDDIHVTSLTSYRELNYSTDTDLDSTSAPLTPMNQFEDDWQFSEELQITGKSARLDWLAGVFYFRENDGGANSIPLNNLIVGFPFPGTLVQGYYAGGVIKTDAFAVFGQATYEIVDGLKITLGARYNTEKKTDIDQILLDFVTPYDPATRVPLTLPEANKRFNSFTPRIALDYQATPDILLYASWSKGFKAGTYNLGTGTPPVDPEKVDAFEGGIKSTLFDRALRLNLAGFYYDYKDLQVGKVIGSVVTLENAATAMIYGLEAELQAKLTPEFEINANASWLHARYKDFVSFDPARAYGDGTSIDPSSGYPAFNLKGNSLSMAPDFTFFFGAQYTIPSSVGDFSLRGEVNWKDRVYFTAFNITAISQAPAAKANAFLNWKSTGGNVDASLFVKNITNKTILGNANISSGLVGFPIQGYFEDPRTYGIRIGYSF